MLRRIQGEIVKNKAMSGKPKVFITRPDIPESALSLLRNRYELDIWPEKGNIPRDILLKKITGTDGLFITSASKVDDEFLNAAGKNLKAISTMSVGYDHIDLDAAKKRGVKLGHTAGVLDDSVAELTMAVLLSRTRRLFEGHQTIVDGTWTSWVPWTWLNGIALKDAVVGIIGLGRIGTEVARRLLAFKVPKLFYTSRSEKKAAAELNAVKVELYDLLAQSDIIIITCALNDETRNMISDKEFQVMKKSAIIVNTSRGSVIDQDALIRALKSSQIGGAALDVMSPEPLPPDHELLSFPNVVTIPHLGSADLVTRTAMAELTARNLIAGIEGQPLPAEIM